MTTKMHRLTISLPDDVLAAVRAMAEAENRPASKVIVGVLTEFAPMLLQVANFHKQVAAGKTSEAKRTMQTLFGDQLATVLTQQLDLQKAKK